MTIGKDVIDRWNGFLDSALYTLDWTLGMFTTTQKDHQ